MMMTTYACLGVAGVETSVLRHFVIDGGPITWFVLLPLSVVTLALTIHYLIAIRRGTQVPPKLARALLSTARQGQMAAALEITRYDHTMLGRATHAACSSLPSGREPALAAIDEAVDAQAGRLLRRIEYLNVIGNIAPMIGLLGTVVGMIQAFSRIYAAGTNVDATRLVGDISIALVNTFWGLFIAIPGLSAYALLRNRIEAYAAESIKLCDGMVALMPSKASEDDPNARQAALDAVRSYE